MSAADRAGVPPDTAELLKRGPHREVWLVRGGEPRIVKRFSSRGALRRLLDGARARREARIGSHLAARGVAVPSPLGFSTRDGAIELSLAWIEKARPLSDLLSGAWPAPVAPELLARRLGTLLARARAAGLDQADLHAGNLLVDPTGRPWLIDFARARLVRRSRARDLLRDLALIAAATRERVPARLRRRGLVAWRRALPEALARRLPPPALLAARVEAEARRLRARAVRRHAERWLRESGVAREVGAGRVVPRGRDPKRPGDLVLRAGGGTGRTSRQVEQAWLVAARLAEHALPAARPGRLERTADPHAEFDLPPGALPLDEAALDNELRRAAWRGLGRLAALLEDRDLALVAAGRPALWLAPDGTVWLGAGDSTLLQGARGADPWRALGRALLGEPGEDGRAAFGAGLHAEPVAVPGSPEGALVLAEVAP